MNIKTVMFYQSLFPNRFFYLEDITDYGTFEKMFSLKNYNPLNIKIKKEFKKDLFYMKNINYKENCFYKYLIKGFFNEINIFDKTKQHEPLNEILKFIKCVNYNKNQKKYFNFIPNYKESFIYFPLHMQPELTSSVIANEYSDQLLAIEKLSNLIPNDWKIYVKENPKQNFYQRDELFFKRLKSINKVKLISKKVNTYKLLKNCTFPATITGTVGYEAISGGKPVLIFGNPWYKNLPGVIKYHETITIEDILNTKITHQNLENSVNKLISHSFKGIVDKNYIKIFPQFNPEKNKNYIKEAILKVLNA